jgi:hypothetical protein
MKVGDRSKKILAAVVISLVAVELIYILAFSRISMFRVVEGLRHTDRATGLRFEVMASGGRNGANEVWIIESKDTEKRELVIPSDVTIGGRRYSVTGVSARAFSGWKSLESLVIPASMANISHVGFSNIESLKKVVISEGVESIDGSAFYYCKSLESVEFPKSLTSIGATAFSGCQSLVSVDLPDNLTGIGKGAFSGCSSLTGADIPDSVTYVGDGAFEWCKSLVSVTLPSGLTSIGNSVFSQCSSLESVIIPDGVTSISYGAFRNCSSLAGVALPENLASILNEAFYRCSSLSGIALPDGLTSIGVKAFAECESLTVAAIPDSVTSVGQDAFSGSEAMIIYCEAKVQPEGWNPGWNPKNHETYWNAEAGSLVQDDNGLKYVKVPKENKAAVVGYVGDAVVLDIPGTTVIGGARCEVTDVAPSSFSDCRSLKSVFVPPGVGYPSITEAFGYGNAFLVVYGEAESPNQGWLSGYDDDDSDNFAYWSVKSGNFSQDENGIQYIKTSDGKAMVTRYAGAAASLSIPGTTEIGGETLEVTVIGDGAFFNCESLISVFIPKSVSSIPNFAFDWLAFTTIYCEARAKPGGWVSYWNSQCPTHWGIRDDNFAQDENGFQYIRTADGKAAVSRYAGEASSLAIPDAATVGGKRLAVTVIEKSAFFGQVSIVSVDIPGSIHTIGEAAFEGCASLASLKIPAGVRSIGKSAFAGCDSLTEVEIPPKVREISASAFTGCGALKEIVIPSGVREIGESAFFNCESLSSVRLPASLEYIGESAFGLCVSLTEIVIPNSVREIGASAFLNCESLRSVTIPPRVRSIERYTFSGCRSLSEVTLPPNLREIGESAFSVCRALSEIVIPSGVRSIGDGAFASCESLTGAVIPPSVREIGGSAFSGCKALAELTIPNGVRTIAGYAFHECESLDSVFIPASVTSVGESAFRSCRSLAVYSGAKSQPKGWSGGWNPDPRPVIWGVRKGDFTQDRKGIQYVKTPDGKAAITNYAGGESSLVIPAMVVIGGVSRDVASIGDYAFSRRASLTRIVIPDGVETIGLSAFSNCKSLWEVDIPDSVKVIGKFAFARCVSLSKILIPRSVTSIGKDAFIDSFNLSIYCEAESLPEGWSPEWNPNNRPTEWGADGAKTRPAQTYIPRDPFLSPWRNRQIPLRPQQAGP